MWKLLSPMKSLGNTLFPYKWDRSYFKRKKKKEENKKIFFKKNKKKYNGKQICEHDYIPNKLIKTMQRFSKLLLLAFYSVISLVSKH